MLQIRELADKASRMPHFYRFIWPSSDDSSTTIIYVASLNSDFRYPSPNIQITKRSLATSQGQTNFL